MAVSNISGRRICGTVSGGRGASLGMGTSSLRVVVGVISATSPGVTIANTLIAPNSRGANSIAD